MLSTLLTHASWLPATVLLVLLLAGPFIGAAIAPCRRLLWALFTVSVIAVGGLTLYPEGGAVGRVTCTPGVPYFALGAVETLANVLLFIPPVLLAGVLFRRPLLAVLGGSVLSALIEFLQAVAPIIGRACDTGDWITNTIGAVLGGLIAGAALALKRRSRATS